MSLSMLLVHALWPLRLEAAWGWSGYLRAGLGGMIGGLLWVALDRSRQAFELKPLPPP